MQHLTEIDRERYGGHYDPPSRKRAINAHSERTYRDADGQLFRLVRDLDAEGKPFEAYGPFRADFRGFPPRFQVGGQDCFGEGRSWETAEALLDEEVRHYRYDEEPEEEASLPKLG